MVKIHNNKRNNLAHSCESFEISISSDGATAKVLLYADSHINFGKLTDYHNELPKIFAEHGIVIETDIYTTEFQHDTYYDSCEYYLTTIIKIISWDKIQKLKELFEARLAAEKAAKKEANKKRRLEAEEARKAQETQERAMLATLKKKYEN